MTTASLSLSDLCGRYWAMQCDEFPTAAIMASKAVVHDELLREAPADHERRAHAAGAMLAELNGISQVDLSAADRVTHAMLARDLQSLIDTVTVRAHLQPSIYPLGPEFLLGY